MKKIVLATSLFALSATTASAATVTVGMASSSVAVSSSTSAYTIDTDPYHSGFLNFDSDSLAGVSFLGLGIGFTDVEGASVTSIYLKPKANLGWFMPNDDTGFAKNTTVYAKIGTSMVRGSGSDNGADASSMYGLGVNYKFSESFGVSMQYNSLYTVSSYDMESTDMGLSYNF